MTYREWIKNLEKEFVGKKVSYDGRLYNIVKVDYNGFIHIDKPSQYNDSTAVYEPYQARKALI